MITDLSKEAVVKLYQGMEDPKALDASLGDLSPKKLKELAANLNVELKPDKASTIIALVKAIGKEAASQKSPQESPQESPQKSAEAPQEDAGEHPQEDGESSSAPPEVGVPDTEEKPKDITSIVMGRGERGATVEVVVNPKWKRLIPRPSDDDMKRITASVKKTFEEGGTLSERIKVRLLDDGKFEAWDGHTRLDILTKLKIPITEDMLEVFEMTDTQVAEEIFKLNVTRRHMTDAQKIKLAEKFMPHFKEEKKSAIQKKKEAEAAKKKAEKAARKAAERTKRLESNKKRLEAEAARKEQRKKEREAAKAAKEAEKATEQAEKTKGRSRDKKAEVTGVNPATIRLRDWCWKWCPDYLDEQTDKGVEIGTIYGVAHDTWWATVKKYSPAMLDEIKAGKKGLFEAYQEALENKPAQEYEPGPMESLVQAIKKSYFEELKKKYGSDLDGKIDGHEANHINVLDGYVTKFQKTNS